MKKLGSFTMMCLLMLFTFQGQGSAKQTIQTNSFGLEDFYKYLGSTISYPAKARMNSLQGNSMVLFTISLGKVKDLKIQTALGDDCDGEVLNRILAYRNFAKIKSGKYALTTTFKLEGSNAAFLNADVKIPVGYSSLKVTVVGYASKEATVSIKSVNGNGIKTKENVMFMSSSNKFRSTDKEPLVILDDNVLEYGALHTVDPNNIQSIAILKNINTNAKYGDEGRNGVIIITSKYYVPKKVKIEQDTVKKN